MNGRHGCGEVTHDLLADAVDVLGGLLDRDEVLHAGDHAIAPRAEVGVGQLFRGEAERNPDLGLIETACRQWKLEAARHNADDGIGAAIENDGLPNDAGVAMIAIEPQRIADEGERCVGVVLLRGEDAAQNRPNAERREDSSAEACTGELLGSSVAGKLVAGDEKRAHGRKRPRRVLVGGDFARGDAHARALADMITNQDQAARIGEWQRSEKNAFDEREDGDGRAHAQRQREDGGQVERGRLEHLAKGEAKVVQHGAAPGSGNAPLDRGSAAAGNPAGHKEQIK